MSGGEGEGIQPGPRPGPWYEDEAFWTAYAPLMFDEKRWAEVPAVVDAIEALASPPKGGRVLDAACGPGRHSLELAARGYRVTGVDLTAAYLEAARESAAAFGLEIELVRADLRGFSRPAAFDLAINLYTSFGYFEEAADDLALLRGIRASLKPGGALVLETQGKETAARDFVEGEWFERGGMTIMTEYEVVGAWEGLRNRWIVLRGEGGRLEKLDRSFVIRLYSGAELRALLLEAGFSRAELYGGLRGEPYDQKAESLVALARA
ncbi:MAG TPA: methyltransferase domain-containing protein [Spirochaetales bacterium]|nr:methyltransferase domain-containing protein [Spirochaetales bacterium]HRY53904.1 methyltransferase domain-containing protein [Spirochaetia bacterium]